MTHTLLGVTKRMQYDDRKVQKSKYKFSISPNLKLYAYTFLIAPFWKTILLQMLYIMIML